jgi:hypothetical protein
MPAYSVFLSFVKRQIRNIHISFHDDEMVRQ